MSLFLLTKRLILYQGQHVGHLFQSLLQGLLHHGFHEGVELHADGELHLALGLARRHNLYPQVEGQRRGGSAELDALLGFAFDNLQRNGPHGGHFDTKGICRERQVLHLVFGQAVLDFLQIAQIGQFAVNGTLEAGITFTPLSNFVIYVQLK